MNCKWLLIGTFLIVRSLLIITADQSPLALEHALQQCIKDGNYEAFLQQGEQLATLGSWNLETLLSCLGAHRRALVAEHHLLNHEVSERVAAIHETIKERFDAQVAKYAERAQEDSPVHDVDYDVVANTFVYEEVMNQAPRWCFWQRDYNRECALKIFSDLRGVSVSMSANNIHQRIEGLSTEDKEAYIAREQQETDMASTLVQKTLDTHFKKVYVRYEGGEGIQSFHYERKRPGEEAEWQCVIL